MHVGRRKIPPRQRKAACQPTKGGMQHPSHESRVDRNRRQQAAREGGKAVVQSGDQRMAGPSRQGNRTCISLSLSRSHSLSLSLSRSLSLSLPLSLCLPCLPACRPSSPPLTTPTFPPTLPSLAVPPSLPSLSLSPSLLLIVYCQAAIRSPATHVSSPAVCDAVTARLAPAYLSIHFINARFRCLAVCRAAVSFPRLFRCTHPVPSLRTCQSLFQQAKNPQIALYLW